jgi:hypothetical protein
MKKTFEKCQIGVFFRHTVCRASKFFVSAQICLFLPPSPHETGKSARRLLQPMCFQRGTKSDQIFNGRGGQAASLTRVLSRPY